jgi:hypothetical protein
MRLHEAKRAWAGCVSVRRDRVGLPWRVHTRCSVAEANVGNDSVTRLQAVWFCLGAAVHAEVEGKAA